METPKGNNDLKEEETIRMARNENPYGTSPLATKAIIDNISLISQYPPLDYPDLKDKIAELTSLKPENIGIAAGSVVFIDILTKKFAKPGENIIIPRISFPAYKLLAERYDVKPKIAEMKNYCIDLEAIRELLDNKTRIVFLANPNNPTGTLLSHNEMYSFIKKVKPNVYIVIDEAYLQYVNSKDFHRSLEFINEFKNVIILRSFSKAFGLAGLRIGYTISNQQNISRFESFKVPFSVTRLSTIAAMSALGDDEFIKYCFEKNREEREFLFKKLTKLGFNVVPSEGNFLFIHFSDSIQRDGIHAKLIKNGISTRKTDQFGDKNSLRITVGNHKSNEKLILSLDDKYHSL